MGWVRGHIRHGAVLALAALALQIAVSFGHVHPELRTGVAHAAGAMLQKSAATQGSGQGPAQNPGDDDDYCAICASIFLASTSLVSHAPPLPVPLRFQRIEHSLGIARGIVQPPRVAFQSRAPPIV